jgi:hypothetical protein
MTAMDHSNGDYSLQNFKNYVSLLNHSIQDSTVADTQCQFWLHEHVLMRSWRDEADHQTVQPSTEVLLPRSTFLRHTKHK